MTVVSTRDGRLEGFQVDGLHAFLGIPFAAPPIGPMRWRAPAPPAPWTGVRQATAWGRQAWQFMMEGLGPLSFAFNASGAANRDEDCLYLNVWTPGLDHRKRPVLVWIHGGGFTAGTGGSPIYAGTALARRGDVVVVTINYRLGALGFLNLEKITGGRIPACGNEGLLDQTMALEWVRDNIEAFGGDPNRVTIFGESAGGMSIGALLAFPRAHGLFHRAIPQSGACSTAHTLARSVQIAQGIVDRLGLSANDDVDRLMVIEPEKLINAGVAQSAAEGAMIFAPCIDGTLLTELPIDAVKRGAADGIPVMTGATRDEWRLFTAMPGFPSFAELDDAALAMVLGRKTSDAETVVQRYRAVRQARGDRVDPVALFAAIETDRVFRIPAIRLAEALAERGQAAYEYLFTWESPWGEGALGSPHAIDLGFVFGTHAMTESSAGFFGSGHAADSLSAHVQDAWLAFASSGNPRTDVLSDWRPYDTRERTTAIFGDPVSVASDPFGEERAVWNELDAHLGDV